MTDGAHILVVDDDVRLRELLRQFLTRSGFHVTTAGDAKEADATLGAITFDLAVIDVMLPGESGLDLTRRLRARGSLPILLLTARSETQDRIAGLASGADDYLPKPFEPDELLLRIRAILRRAPPPVPATPDTVAFGPFRFVIPREELVREGVAVKLTTAEASLLRTLAERADRPVSREELIARGRVDGGERTVDVQVTRLRRKLEDDPKNPRWLQTVRGAGYILRTG
ncbi:MAG: response regulator [Alphaproteobacteria bacterium]|nr:response regulator [Alphaproteobacteria bacterium]